MAEVAEKGEGEKNEKKKNKSEKQVHILKQ